MENLFFILLIVNTLISLYSLYTIMELYVFHNMQGSKLSLKQNKKHTQFSFKKIIFPFTLTTILFFIAMPIFKPIYFVDIVMVGFDSNKFNIVSELPEIWNALKILFILTFFISNYSIFYFLSSRVLQLFPKKKKEVFEREKFSLLVAKENEKEIFLPEKSLYQNILVTGTIRNRKNF